MGRIREYYREASSNHQYTVRSLVQYAHRLYLFTIKHAIASYHELEEHLKNHSKLKNKCSATINLYKCLDILIYNTYEVANGRNIKCTSYELDPLESHMRKYITKYFS